MFKDIPERVTLLLALFWAVLVPCPSIQPAHVPGHLWDPVRYSARDFHLSSIAFINVFTLTMNLETLRQSFCLNAN